MLYPLGLLAVTCLPDCVPTAFHMFVTCWAPGKENTSFQPLTALLPVFLIVTSPLKPLPQSASP